MASYNNGCCIRIGLVAALGLAIGAYMAMGCGSSGSSGSTSSSSDTGASTKSLSTVPTLDLSSYDGTTSSSASSDESLPEKSVSLSKSVFKAGNEVVETRGEGKRSRALCEANFHKLEVIRASQQAQLMRCYPEAMEKGGLLTIPSGKYAYYDIKPPEEKQEDGDKKCASIQSDMKDEIKACKEEKGPENGMRLRIGRITNDSGTEELRVNMCLPSATDSSKYTETESGAYSVASATTGTSATISVVHTNTFNGHKESHALSASGAGIKKLDDDGVPTEWDSSAGLFSATARMSGGFGSGTSTYAYNPAENSTAVTSGFVGSFKEHRTGATTSFTGKVYAKGDGTSGTACAKYSVTGKLPGMFVKDMIPFNIGSSSISDFLKTLSMTLGIEITTDNYKTKVLCLNPKHNPLKPDPLVKHMVPADSSNQCAEGTNEGIDCGTISNVKITDPFGKRDRVEQTFASVADATTAKWYNVVKDFDLSTIKTDAGSFAHLNSWDCAADADGFKSLDFSSVTAEQAAKIQSAILTCSSIEEKARNNNGFAGYNCSGQEAQVGVNQIAQKGPNTGKFGGEYFISTNNCQQGGGQSDAIPRKIFLSLVDNTTNKYTIQDKGVGHEVTFSNGAVSGLSISYDEFILTGITLTVANDKATGGTFTFRGKQDTQGQFPCTGTATNSQPNFTAQTEPAKGEQGKMPKECVEKKLTFEQCGDFCDPKKGRTCTPPTS